MISDEPDEDADTLDDDTTIGSFLQDGAATPDATAVAAAITNWPPQSSESLGLTSQDFGLNIDPDTLAWFKATHADWRRQMRAVLRAWMVANIANPQISRLASGPDEYL